MNTEHSTDLKLVTRAVGYLLFELALYLRGQPVAAVLTSPSDIEVEPEEVTHNQTFLSFSELEADRITRAGFPVLFASAWRER